MYITTHRPPALPDRVSHAAAADHANTPRQGPEPSGLTTEEIRRIVLEILG
jgi:hypothetical protein